jgi:uncharacterized protein (DUF952 family)
MTFALFHIATIADWSPDRLSYAPAALAVDGFVHCSLEHQVVRVANQRFAGRQDLVLLCIDPLRLGAPIRYENLEGGDEMFPHVYGPIEVAAIVSAAPFIPSADGWICPPADR